MNNNEPQQPSLDQLLSNLDNLIDRNIPDQVTPKPDTKTITYAIGDLQGCYDELRRLLDKIKFDPEKNRLWLTGDLVNRGPNSLPVMRFIKTLGNSAITVLGNHELQLMAAAAGVVSVKKKDTIAGLLEAPDIDELIYWLRHQAVMHYDKHLGYAMVHAGLHPKWDLQTALECAAELEKALRTDKYFSLLKHLNNKSPLEWSSKLKGMERLCFICNCFTQLRYCDKKGRLILDTNSKSLLKKGYIPWFKLPKRLNKNLPIVFGHWASLPKNEEMPKNIFPMDSACVHGGSLSALYLEKNRYYKVRCREAKAYS